MSGESEECGVRGDKRCVGSDKGKRGQVSGSVIVKKGRVQPNSLFGSQISRQDAA